MPVCRADDHPVVREGPFMAPERIFLEDSYVREFEALVTERPDGWSVLSRTAFHPGGAPTGSCCRRPSAEPRSGAGPHRRRRLAAVRCPASGRRTAATRATVGRGSRPAA